MPIPCLITPTKGRRMSNGCMQEKALEVMPNHHYGYLNRAGFRQYWPPWSSVSVGDVLVSVSEYRTFEGKLCAEDAGTSE